MSENKAGRIRLHQNICCDKKIVDDGKYFCINRARQYGKTTTIKCLAEYMKALLKISVKINMKKIKK